MRTLLRPAGIGLLVVFIASLLTLGSPFALDAISAIRIDWARASDVGQSYGLLSAILSGAALIGIVVSLSWQRKQTSIAQRQAGHMMQVEISRLAMDDPETYAPSWGPRRGGGHSLTEGEWRARIYTNLLFAMEWFSWEIGASNEQTIRNVVRNSLLGTEGREYYEAARELFKSELGAGNRRDRKFLRIVEEEYAAVVSSPPEKVIFKPQPSVRTQVEAPTSTEPSPWPRQVSWASRSGFGSVDVCA